MAEGKNVVTTHQLFSRLGDHGIQLIKSFGYICFIDETLDCVNSYDGDDELNAYDTAGVLKAYAYVDKETGLIKWRDENYRGKFTPQKELADNDELAYYNDSVMMRIFPLKVLTCFKEVYVLTKRCMFLHIYLMVRLCRAITNILVLNIQIFILLATTRQTLLLLATNQRKVKSGRIIENLSILFIVTR